MRFVLDWRFLLLCASLLNGAHASSFEAYPDSSLSPAQVVRFQMEALRDNDSDDRGIATAFRFASPDNKRSTGPLPRFIHMIKHSTYSVMLGPQLIEYGDVEIADDQARLSVSVLTHEFVAVSFRFHLSRQSQGGCIGCWMTDSVTVEDMRRLPGVKT